MIYEKYGPGPFYKGRGLLVPERAMSTKKGLPFVSETSKGVVIEVRVQPGTSREGLKGLHGGRLKVALNAPPVEGAANRALVKFLSKFLGTAKNNLTITKGLKSRDKTVCITGMGLKEVEEAFLRVF